MAAALRAHRGGVYFFQNPQGGYFQNFFRPGEGIPPITLYSRPLLYSMIILNNCQNNFFPLAVIIAYNIEQILIVIRILNYLSLEISMYRSPFRFSFMREKGVSERLYNLTLFSQTDFDF